ncbi:leucyl aminopeptidase [Brooklawnia cerclae]|uniref:Probable cytosol aminopeptidase n=1 Tax=Brooklawnia cerclae TaxID=349934 RepID=A0ABX0SGP9_9ACTN|nr:leucyl aminopeptidase [Brooklawnia cerclae]NIH57567.1 leucyl aminopeptidase [Brooklawnia cerclae]
MATQQQPLFDPSRFDPSRVRLPAIELTRSIGKATDVVIGMINPRGRATLVGAPPEVEREASRNGGPLLSQLLDQGARADLDVVALLTLPGVRVVVVGLGDDVDLAPEDLRRAAGIGVRRISQIDSPTPHRVAISLEATTDTLLRAVAEGSLLATHTFRKLTREPAAPRIESVSVIGGARSGQQALDAGRVCAEAVCVARDWADLPPNLLGPGELADQTRYWLKDARIDVEVLDEKALDKAGFGGVLAVGGGSVRPPRLVRLDYHPRGAHQHLALVGKGITYDSGGYNLKGAESLFTMKHDMAGAAAVIAATRTIADLGLPVHVTTYAPLAESMISGSAYRPGDVITMYDGTTVENADSDCEGRIVLADALARANEDSPDLVVDIATLTGACVVALGTRIGGLMASDDATADRLLDAAEAAGEEFWQLPITRHTRSLLTSEVADLRSKRDRFGGATYAGAFLQHFVAEGTAWAHLDVAGPAWNRDAPHDYVPAQATGMGVRTLVALAEAMSH